MSEDDLLSANFREAEFAKDAPIPPECLPIARRLCVEILEPLREQAGCALEITSGFRPPAANAEAHGIPNSEHIWTPDWCAADFFPVGHGVTARTLFDWARNNPYLPFHQLILEGSRTGITIIHVSINRLKPGLRSVLTGAQHNAEIYFKADFVDYQPQKPEPETTT